MRLSLHTGILVTLALLAEAVPTPEPRALPLVQSNQLRRLLLRSELLKKGQTLQDFAYATVGRNRYIGTPGHNATVNYLVDTLTATGYYDIEVQPFTVPSASADLSVDGVTYEAAPMTFTAAGTPSGPLIPVANIGCDAADYPAELAGKIALISRGTCTFATKAALSKAAGAIGTVIYNNVEGLLQGTLGGEGNYAPTVGISQADGQTLLALVASGTATAGLIVELSEVLTYNVIAQTKGGDKENVLAVGAHIDSVEAGPGINDNGSGSIGNLEVALQLTKFSTNNAIRFGWWSGEEEGLLGAEHYVTTLPQEERDKIRLYINFDMIASPNFVYEIYDGDGSAFGTTGPPGSAEIEKLWEDYYKNDVRIPTQPTEFDGRSDYGPFLDFGIASGGLSSGADGVKTEEEVALYGGTAGQIYDPNYHTAQDILANTNVGVWVQMAKGIAHAVATYGRSFETLPAKTKRSEKREAHTYQRKGGKWVY
ncbi:putative leucine aminopeptidase 2 [Hyaloscypha bicolor E]|uniref:Peptide hydrolase n=1 Tax=Hyaloscypha bicolor E TaxID=1095630 RepID=A0A2J6SKE4_9HELO|nr:putative leucine aminopeptidase 2 [Hyaloscypha bicolor E]PMD51227.1 putative leucine aminopeptidase 2 [Hyaloscypha bicolor E]